MVTLSPTMREAERDRQYAEYKDRIGEIVNGIVKRVEYGNVVVDLGRGEAIIRRDEMLPRETLRNGDRVRLDAGAGTLQLLVSDAELKQRIPLGNAGGLHAH